MFVNLSVFPIKCRLRLKIIKTKIPNAKMNLSNGWHAELWRYVHCTHRIHISVGALRIDLTQIKMPITQKHGTTEYRLSIFDKNEILKIQVFKQ